MALKYKSSVFFCMVTLTFMFAVYLLFNSKYLANDNQEIKRVAEEQVVEEKVVEAARARLNDAEWLSLSKFVPYGLRQCEDLFKINSEPEKVFSDEYLKASKEHVRNINESIEGNSGAIVEQRMTFWTLAKADFVKTVCETGFNAGHSALVWLNAKPTIQLYSFDLGSHQYAFTMAEFLKARYPGRLHLTWGDSTQTLVDFHRQHPNVTCDIVLIDGGHTTNVAFHDFENFKKMVTATNVVIMDDFPSTKWNFMSKLGEMWESEKKMGNVIEIFSCMFQNGRGFSVGRYNI